MDNYWKYEDDLIKEYPEFIYELEIYKKEYNSWNLEESGYYSSTTTIKELIPFIKYDYKDYSLFKYVTLIAAPSKWLKQHAVQVTIELVKKNEKELKMKKMNLKDLKIVKYFEQKISNFTYHWDYLRVLDSPFKGLRLQWYWGEIQHGTPYFLPRKWVKMTKEDCEECLARDQKSMLRQYMVNRTWEHYKQYKKPVPIKYFGFNATTLGWKTKWDEYRYEWAPCYSLVIFGKQLFVTVLPDVGDDCLRWDVYWEAWLNYSRLTDKTKSKQERLEELIKKYSCTWITHSKDEEQELTDLLNQVTDVLKY